jgi:hypothetical protein
LTSADCRPGGSIRLGVCIVAFFAWSAGTPIAEQAMTVNTSGGVLRVVAPAFEVIEGAVLERLRDGRSVRLDFELEVIAQPQGPAVVQARRSFNLSFDLWEERFAVTLLVTPPRSVSHLTRKAGEAWCLENLTIPLGELARFGGSTSFWIRLAYRVPNQVPGAGSDEETFTLQRLIDVLGRKPRDMQLGKSTEAGPFRLSR